MSVVNAANACSSSSPPSTTSVNWEPCFKAKPITPKMDFKLAAFSSVRISIDEANGVAFATSWLAGLA